MSEIRQIRVFISSTFRDMQAERDYLVKFIFPQLRKLCESRGVTWSAVDLRWGITQEEAAEGKILPICLEEIRRCRPYFIGLLGERYGWVPQSIPDELFEKETWLREQFEEHKSVTELEILHGVLRDPTMAEHAFFYFRDPAYVNLISENHRQDFTAENPESKEKLQRLKNRIRHVCDEQICHLRENYPSPQELGQLILKDFTRLINEIFPEASQPDPLDREAMEHEAYAKNRERVYVGRPEYFDRLYAHAEGGGDQPLVILGESGSGKSALLANWVARYRQEHPEILVLQHYIGATPYSADWAAMLRRLMGEFKRRLGLQQDIPDKPDVLRSDFTKWLQIATARGRVLLVLDALNQLEDRDDALGLGWLPSVFPRNCIVVLTTLPGRSLDTIRGRKWPELTVGPLTLLERKRLIAEFLAQFNKSLGAASVERIALAEQTANPLFLRTMLDELSQFGAPERFGERIEYYLAARTPDQLYERILQRWERVYGPDLVRQSFSLIWAAPRGLSEVELLDLLGKGGQPLPHATWAPFYLAAGETLVFACYGLTFAHPYLSTAVEKMYLQTAEERYVPHKLLARFYFSMELPTLGGNLKALRFLPFHACEANENYIWVETMTDFGFLHAVVGRVNVTDGVDAEGNHIPWHAGYFVVLDEIQRWLGQKPTLREAADLIEPLNTVWERHPDFVRSAADVMPMLYCELKALEKTPPKEIYDRNKRSIVRQDGPLLSWCERERHKYEKSDRPWTSMTTPGATTRFLAFISYRREGGAETARLISKELRDRGVRAFLDVDDLASGHFDERLLREIETVPNFIVILTPGCLVRCRFEGDWLRREIEHAIKTERNLIPILKDGFDFPPTSELPLTMAELEKNNGVRYDHVLFAATMERLVSFLKR
jgi:hypothetical protein